MPSSASKYRGSPPDADHTQSEYPSSQPLPSGPASSLLPSGNPGVPPPHLPSSELCSHGYSLWGAQRVQQGASGGMSLRERGEVSRSRPGTVLM